VIDTQSTLLVHTKLNIKGKSKSYLRMKSSMKIRDAAIPQCL